jgi:thiol:disulfide interchange protein
MKIRFLFFLLTVLNFSAFAQMEKHAAWKFTVSKSELKVGESLEITIEATIDQGWYLYSTDFDPNLDALPTIITFEGSSFKESGRIKAIGAKDDSIGGGNIKIFTGKAVFKQKLIITKSNPQITVNVDGQVCSHEIGLCVRVKETHLFNEIKASGMEVNTPDTGKAKQTDTSKTKIAAVDTVRNKPLEGTQNLPFTIENIEEVKHESLIYFLVTAFIFGFVSLLTPCVFPMIPLTVTFFTNASLTRGQAVRKGLVYGISIVIIFTLVGLIFGASLANVISTHWLPNVLFFVVFVFFGLSFLGLFEITLPASFVNKMDRQADKGGYYGVFFMAFTLVLVSFSCTAPIVGALLVEAAGGQAMKPILGMVAYSSAFAIPFALFAMFPSWLNALPKSGGWMNVIKVSLGIIELGLAFKFLSIADQVYHWNILDRDIYIAIWIVLSIILGFYFLGKIRFPHDSETHFTSVPRLIMAMCAFVFAVYLIPGMFGAPLKMLSGYLPPMSSHDFSLPEIIREYNAGNNPSSQHKILCDEPKYSKGMKLPHGLKGYFEYQQALSCAREKKIPLFIDFTGHGCVSCREMEANVWSDPEVLKVLNNDYMIVALYVDDRTAWIDSTGKSKKTLGDINYEIQAKKFGTNAQPYYVLLDPVSEKKLAQSVGYDPSIPNFLDFLEKGKKNFRLLNQRK